VRRQKGKRVKAVLGRSGRVGLVASKAPKHLWHAVQPGKANKRRGIVRRGRIVYRVRGGKVRWVAAARPAIVNRPARLRDYLRRAGVR
jgi:hypothetical protein